MTIKRGCLYRTAELVHMLAEGAHGAGVRDRFNGGKEGSLWYYDALAQAFQEHQPGHSAKRFAAIVAMLHVEAR